MIRGLSPLAGKLMVDFFFQVKSLLNDTHMLMVEYMEFTVLYLLTEYSFVEATRETNPTYPQQSTG